MARETMDPELLNTCQQGDVENLKKLYDTHRHDYEFFLTPQVSSGKRNILHVMLHYDKQHPSFIKEALEILPIQVVCQLICLPNAVGDNPLHQVAYRNKADINARLLVDAYKRSSDVVVGDDLSSRPPWRAENKQRKIPAQIAISWKNDEVAAFLISEVDPDIFKFVDADKLMRESILKGCFRTVNVILKSNYGHNIDGFDPRRIENKSDVRYVSLLQHHPEIAKYLDHSGKTQVLGHATKIGAVDVVKTILNIDISNSYTLLIGPGNYNLLYIAVKRGYLEIAHLILDAFNKFRECQAPKEREAPVWSYSRRRSFHIQKQNLPAAAKSSLLSFQPLRSQPCDSVNETGKTPLSVAFCDGHWDLAAEMLLSDFALLSDLADIYKKPRSIIPAMEQHDVINYIERHMRQHDKTQILVIYLEVFLRFLRENSDDKNRKLVQKYPELIRFKDVSGQSMLQYLVEENDVDAMILILKIQPSTYIETQHGEHEHLLMGVCRKGNLSAIHAICDLRPNCPQLFIRHEDQTTVLHIVKLENLKEYRSLLGIPEIAWLKNKTDARGKSPLIRAIQEDDIYLAQALLEMEGIDFMDIKGPEGKTAAQMLKDKRKESEGWDTLYNKVKKTTSYVTVETDLKEMRNTLSVVAALLATITFAAAFTVPGGFDQNNGDVLLGQRVSFIVFILSDTYAMCCSMIVLCSLIWSMVLDSDEARLLIDQSVFVLLQSLYGTLVAFMTGVYTMMSHKTLWVAIVVCAISSCVCVISRCVPIIVINRKVLVTVLNKVVPTSRPESSPPSSAESGIDPASSDGRIAVRVQE